MTDPNELLWNQAIADENWPEAIRIQRLAEGIGQTAAESSAEIIQSTQTLEVE